MKCNWGTQMPQEKWKWKLNEIENKKGTLCLKLAIFQIKQKLSIHFRISRAPKGSIRMGSCSIDYKEIKKLFSPKNTPLSNKDENQNVQSFTPK